jgi:hypothetical protein
MRTAKLQKKLTSININTCSKTILEVSIFVMLNDSSWAFFQLPKKKDNIIPNSKKQSKEYFD